MERMIKEEKKKKRKLRKEISLNIFLLRFLFEIVIALIAAVVLWLIFVFALSQTKQVVGASVVEKNVENWIPSVKLEDVIEEKSIPAYTKYAIFSKEGVCLQSNYPKQNMEMVTEFAKSQDMTNQAGIGQKITRKVITNTQIIVVSYEIKAFLINAITGDYICEIETILLITLLVLLFITISFVIVRTGKKLKQKVLLMQDAAIQIGKQDLNVTVQNTGIREFNQVMESLNILSHELRESLQEKWQMEQQKKRQLSSLAHDIKTPLTVLQGNLELLEESELNEDQKNYLDYMKQNEEKIHEYVLKMLEVSRNVEENRNCDLKAFWPDFQKNMEILGLDKKLKIEFHIEESITHLKISEQDLQRILSNIIENAVTYSPMAGKIICSLYEKKTAGDKKENWAVFNITDEGAGFTSKDIKFASEEFYQADESRGNKEHFGMGLTIAKELLIKNKGILLLENREEDTKIQGASVSVMLPI